MHDVLIKELRELKKILIGLHIVVLFVFLFCFSCAKEESDSNNNLPLSETECEDVFTPKQESTKSTEEIEKETNSFVSNCIPPIQFNPTLHNDLISFIHLYEKDDIFVQNYLKQNHRALYSSWLRSKADIIDIIDTMEKKGFPILKKTENYQYGWVQYFPENFSKYIYKGLFTTHYVIDDMIYEFTYSNNCEEKDFIYLESEIKKTFTFDGTDVILYHFYDKERPKTIGRYGGTCKKDGYSVEILVRNCRDINDINLEQFEWVHTFKALEKLDKFKNATMPDLPPC